ncbi:MAG: epoxyqueuosine reductase [Candidatus Tectomicrobia bacterium]|uniref:Epoxyqueuosine reductase n=1 Tax=Tectimicrobiota bacterium TaxID=2528274 RepID=A0A932CPB3_UNCTE|nr:epoxyqueuosine reductase [Candidatus Tectomicrobia bacterium]
MEQENAVLVERSVKEFVAHHPTNRHPSPDQGPYFGEPLMGCADGDDPLFATYKEIIGPFHFTPREVLERAVVEGKTSSQKGLDQIRVICYILPTPEETIRSNAQERRYPSLRWAHTRNFGEMFNVQLRQHLVSTLEGMGYAAIAPMISPYFQVQRVGDFPQSSNWSERHAAYAAGLGTFSLNDGLITPAGIAIRCGTVVTNLPLPVSPRPYTRHTQNCLFYRDGSCGVCRERCPAGAITEAGHDKARCVTYMLTEVGPACKGEYQVDITGCGLCQTGVPCQSRIP